MRTILDIEDIKNIIDDKFNGNLWAFKASKGAVAYENPNSEKIYETDEFNGTSKMVDLAENLNIRFYSWGERLDEKDKDNRLLSFDAWVQSLNFSMNEAYALVEKVDEEATPSQDIDNATVIGKVTFLVQRNKITNLDYYVSKIRNKFLGVPDVIQNRFGDKIKAYFTFGSLNYDQEPLETPLGEMLIVTSNFRISYLTDAITWDDTKVEISLDNETTYLEMPITKDTRQVIFNSNPLPRQERPDIVGSVVTSLSTATTYTYYDINKDLTNALNDLFYSLGAIRIDGVATTVRDVNIPVFVRLTTKINGEDKTYVYRDVIENMQKVRTNSDFNISSITTRAWGKTLTTEGVN